MSDLRSTAPSQPSPASNERRRPWLAAFAVYLALSTLLRLALGAHFVGAAAFAPRALAHILPIGLHLDVTAGWLLLLPAALWLTFLPERVYRSRAHRAALWIAFFLFAGAQVFARAAEWFFFDEFDARFNTVAVDYLLFPTEVFVNIWDSYPVARVVAGCAVIAALATWLARPWLRRGLVAPTRFVLRLRDLGAWAAVGLVLFFSSRQAQTRWSGDRVLNELAGNGEFSFMYAATTNNLDYGAYYATVPRDEAYTRAARLSAAPNATPAAPGGWERRVTNGPPPERPRNLVLILVESFGSEFWGSLGRQPSLTPRMDALAARGTLFTHLYASGNRTVRGLEGVLSSFPPLPGDSIVKRDRSDHVATLARTLGAAGYETAFLYGGRGVFDDIRSFTTANGFARFVEQKDFRDPVFTTIWGVSDEDLFRRAVAEAGELAATGKPFFEGMLTVSNHKPYTYPPGRIPEDPERRRRDHAVKYTDWALGLFFELAAKEPWYQDTIFAVVADHGARVYGKQTIPIPSYEIPLLVVDPRQPAPRRIDVLGGSLDVGPTLLGMLGLDYPSVYFGRDLLRDTGSERWAVMHHNRDVGFLRGDHLVVLGLGKTIEHWQLDRASGRLEQVARRPTDEEQERDAMAVFEVADDLYTHERFRPGAAAAAPPPR